MKKCMKKDEGLIKPISILLIVLAVGGILTIAIAIGGAEPLSPMGFYGEVTINGLQAPDSTVIEAYIDGELKSGENYDVAGGRYVLSVTGSESDNGKQIIFKINGFTTDQTSTFIASVPLITEELDLSVNMICGDVNNDGVVGIDDVDMLVQYEFDDVLINECVGDVDGNGVINVLDVRLLMNHVSDQQGYPLNCGCI